MKEFLNCALIETVLCVLAWNRDSNSLFQTFAMCKTLNGAVSHVVLFFMKLNYEVDQCYLRDKGTEAKKILISFSAVYR